MKASFPGFQPLDAPVAICAGGNMYSRLMAHFKPTVPLVQLDPLELWLNRRCLPAVLGKKTYRAILLEADQEWTRCPLFWQDLRRQQPITPIVAIVRTMPSMEMQSKLAYYYGIVFFCPSEHTIQQHSRWALEQAITLAQNFALPEILS